MATMYETIMSMPLFKGLSFDQVSAFVEKTNLEFKKYSDGDIIVREGEEPKGVKCVVSGKIKIIHSCGIEGKLKIVEILDGQSAIGGERMFGMNTRYRDDIYAKGPVSVMEIGKEQYMNLISSNKIMLLNYLNFLALKSQKIDELYDSYPAGGVVASLSRLISTYTARRAESIRLIFKTEDMAAFLNIPVSKFLSEIAELERRGTVTSLNDGIFINDKEMF